jgi:hypothetical protein
MCQAGPLGSGPAREWRAGGFGPAGSRGRVRHRTGPRPACGTTAVVLGNLNAGCHGWVGGAVVDGKAALQSRLPMRSFLAALTSLWRSLSPMAALLSRRICASFYHIPYQKQNATFNVIYGYWPTTLLLQRLFSSFNFGCDKERLDISCAYLHSLLGPTSSFIWNLV